MNFSNRLLFCFVVLSIQFPINAQQLIATGPHPIHAIQAYQDSLFLGGSFVAFNGNPSNYSVVYNGNGFYYHDQLLGGSGFRGFTVINDTLWGIGSGLTSVDTEVNSIAYREDGLWKGSNSYSVNNTKDVLGMVSYNNELIMAGNFTLPYSRVARYSGNNYYPMDAGFNLSVSSLVVFNGELYAAGVFYASGGTAIAQVAKWNGTVWEEVGGGTDFNVNSMEVWNGSLYIGGTFTTAGGQPAFRVARWDGVAWYPLAGGLTSIGNNPCYVNELRATANGLMIGGRFEMVDGLLHNNLALWDGTSLTPYGNLAFVDEVQAIGNYQGEVYFSTYRFGIGAIAQFFGPGTVGLEEEMQDPAPILFPVPAQDILQVAGTYAPANYTIRDIMGRFVLSGSWQGEPIDISILLPGSYLIQIEGKNWLRFIKAY